MPILGIMASQISGKLWAPAGAYDALATVTVPSGGAASVTFSGIPTGYKHLQVRYIVQTNRGTYGISEYALNFNGDTSSNYSYHELQGDGSGASGLGFANQTAIRGDGTIGTTTGGTFGAGVLDILDYANTNKYKTTRMLEGVDINGTIAGYGGRLALISGNWRNTNAITSMTFIPYTGTLFSQYSQFALYGIK
jgi:hypothetical protein